MLKKTKISLAGILLATSLIAPSGLALADTGTHPMEVDATMDAPLPADDLSTCSSTDTKYGFSFSAKGSTQGTSWRTKDNDSSVYVKITSRSGYAPRFYIDGAYGNLTGKKDCTQGTHYANRTGEFNIYNSVIEDRRSKARLTGWAIYGHGTVNGLWSPDCVGTFPQL